MTIKVPKYGANERTLEAGQTNDGNDMATAVPGDTAIEAPRRRRGESFTMAAPARVAEQDPMIGRELAGYVIARRLAEGGMGVVYVGEHTVIGRKSAIKILKQEFCENSEVVERFYQEARAVNEIKHENIIDIYDFGRDPDGRAFFVMELLVGESLGDRLQRSPLSVQESLPILQQSMKALAAAHGKGVTHRDLKPDNIWLRQKAGAPLTVKLLDFGIAKLRGDSTSKMTKTGQVMGTPDYMSPEQINGDVNIDSRADLYSMGCIIFEMITQQTPFAGANISAVMSGHLFRSARHLDEAPDLAPIVQRLLAKIPADRYQSATEVLSDLDAIARGAKVSRPQMSVTSVGVTASQVQTATVLIANKKRSRLTFAMPVVLALSAAGGVAYWRARPDDAVSTLSKSSIQGAGQEPVEPTVAPSAASALDPEVIRKQSLDVIRQGAMDSDGEHRTVAIVAIGEVRDRDSMKLMLETAQTDANLGVRGAAANTLGLIGDSSVVAAMSDTETKASPELQVWFAAALARLGQSEARLRLEKYASATDLGVALKATLELAELSQPGDKAAIASLQRLVDRESELNQVAPYIGAVLLTKLARLRQPKARDILYSILGESDEGARVAAAVGLAHIGDDGGKQVLTDTLSNAASPNQLLAGKALMELGDYSAFGLFNQKLIGTDDAARATAALGLGKIAELSSVKLLLPLLSDAVLTVRISAAQALLLIVGTEPAMLAQSATDWTKRALASEDLAVRNAGASNIGNLASQLAAPLLAQAMNDKDVTVRRMAASSAGRIRTTASAQSVLAALDKETDVVAKEEMVKALGRIGDAVAIASLSKIAPADNRAGMLAAGALVALGSQAGVARLQTGVGSALALTRLAAVEGSTLANNPAVVPVLLVGLKDKDFAVRFAAAEALAGYQNRNEDVVAVLKTGLAKKDLATQTRALTSLTALHVKASLALNPVTMLDAPYQTVRLSALQLISLLPWADARPLLLRASVDPAPAVRLAVLAQIDARSATDGDGHIALYKGFANDSDPGVQAAAQALLAKHGKSIFAETTKAVAVPAAVDTSSVEQAVIAAADAVRAATKQVDELAALCKTAQATVAIANPDDATVDRAGTLSQQLEISINAANTLHAKAIEQLDKANVAVAAVPAVAARLAAIRAEFVSADSKLAQTKDIYSKAKADLTAFSKNEKQDADLYLATANSALATGRLAEAKAELDRAYAGYRAEKVANPNVDFAYGQLWDKLALREKDLSKRAVLLRRAKAALDTFAAKGVGKRAKQAAARSVEISEELAGGK
jgi:serine/threonine protein kinase/HEAT repeat protein